MKPIPNLEDDAAMAARGRRSALASARNEAAEALRDACTHVQSADINSLLEPAVEAKLAAERLIQVAELWQSIK
jgi:hypothetical protein